MKFYLEDHGLTTVLYLKDDLTFRDVEELGSLLHKVLQETPGSIIVDLDEVPSVDTSIPGQFIAAHREAKTRRRELVLSRVPPLVMQIFRSAHIENLVHLYRGIEDAIADLADRSIGNEGRKLVPEIRCGHEDCVFYTYTKYLGGVVPACQYAYPNEISNGPNCRVYRVNWNQKKWESQTIDSPFHSGGAKRSLYEVRDRASQEIPVPDSRETLPKNFLPDFDSEFTTSPTPMTGHFPPPEAPVAPPAPVPTPAPQPRPAFSDLPADPFADANFPSANLPSVPEPVAPLPPRVAAPPPPVPAPAPTAAAPAPPPEEPLRPVTPEDVVRVYLESWNQGRFVSEYKCLSKKNHTLPQEDYCVRRRAVRAQQVQTHGKCTSQEIGRVDSVSIEGERATVEITRVDRTPIGVHCYAEFYSLVKEDGEWRIRMVDQGEERRNPIVPQKNRTMKASAFAGKEQELHKRPTP